MKQLFLVLLVILIASCSKNDDTPEPVEPERTSFKVSGASSLDNIACGAFTFPDYYHTGINDLPEVGDIIYRQPTGTSVYYSENLWMKIQGNQIMKTDENGIIIELQSCE